jgi:hypothetical protein
MSRNPKSLNTRGQVDTAAFKAWFAGSRVVDDAGMPLVLYHGTAKDFDVFKKGASNFEGSTSALGFFFTGEIQIANVYAVHDFVTVDGMGSNVMPVYLALKNPKRESFDVLSEMESAWTEQAAREYLKDLISGGWDGIIFAGDGVAEYVAFRPEQIKSAIGNRGTFCPDNPDIRCSSAQRERAR